MYKVIFNRNNKTDYLSVHEVLERLHFTYCKKQLLMELRKDVTQKIGIFFFFLVHFFFYKNPSHLSVVTIREQVTLEYATNYLFINIYNDSLPLKYYDEHFTRSVKKMEYECYILQ